MPRWIVLSLVQIFSYPLFTSGGQRYVMKHGQILEQRMFTNERDWLADLLAQEVLHVDTLKEDVDLPLDLRFIQNLFRRQKLDSSPDRTHLPPAPQPAPSTLAVLGSNSLFVLARSGKMFERFFNGQEWVYMSHSRDQDGVYVPEMSGRLVYERPTGPLQTLIPVAADLDVTLASQWYSGIFATTEAGEILQRLADRNGVLVWVDISLPQDHLAHGSVGVRSPHGEVWVLSQSYVIFYRILEHQRWVPRYSRGVSAIGLLLDLEHLEHHQAFGISWPERKLVRASIESKDLVWHTIELPRGVAHLNLTPGARCTNGIFLQGETDNGDNVLLFYFNDRLKDRPKWRFYIVPEIKPGKALVLGQLCASEALKSLFVIVDHELQQFDLTSLTWTNRGRPESTLSNSPLVPSALMNMPRVQFGEERIVAKLENGQLAFCVYRLETSQFEWHVEDTPEDIGVEFCSTDASSPKHCLVKSPDNLV